MATRQWELRERREALQRRLGKLLALRMDTAHGWFWTDANAQRESKEIQEELDELDEEMRRCK